MKNFILFFLVCLWMAGCDYMNIGTAEGGAGGRRYPESGKDSSDVPVITILDTSVFVSALRCVNKDYDWGRDTAYGGDNFHLVLYRNWEEIMSVPAGASCGISPDPDMHHIFEGHLYTEFSDADRTIIGRDGEELFRFEGREFLKGLLTDGDDLYTLSQERTGNGFTYRKNGAVLLKVGSGRITGGFEVPSYGNGGALYRDGAHICFSYRSTDNADKGWYLVCDGKQQQIADGTASVLDVRSINSEVIIAGRASGNRKWETSCLWPGEGEWYRTGELSSRSVVVNRKDAVLFSFPEKNLVMYYNKGIGAMGISVNEDNEVRILSTLRVERKLEGAYRYFSPVCASLSHGKEIIALTPLEGEPYCLEDNRKRTFDGLNGFLTGVETVVSQTTKVL